MEFKQYQKDSEQAFNRYHELCEEQRELIHSGPERYHKYCEEQRKKINGKSDRYLEWCEEQRR